MDRIKERRRLVGNICSNRNISREAIQTIMGKILKLSKVSSFKEVEKNVFIVTFSTKA